MGFKICFKNGQCLSDMEQEDVPKFGTGNGKSSFPSELPFRPRYLQEQLVS